MFVRGRDVRLGAPGTVYAGGVIRMKRQEFVGRISALTKQRSSVVQRVLREFVKLLAESLRAGDKVSVSGLGLFVAKDTKPKKGRNPKTGEIVPIPARRKVSFRPTDGLRRYING